MFVSMRQPTVRSEAEGLSFISAFFFIKCHDYKLFKETHSISKFSKGFVYFCEFLKMVLHLTVLNPMNS